MLVLSILGYESPMIIYIRGEIYDCKLKLVEKLLDFGSVCCGSIYTKTFTLKNLGSRDTVYRVNPIRMMKLIPE